MTSMKDVLASVSRLHGASAEEVAADLGLPLDEIVELLEDLTGRGYVRPIQRGVPVGAVGVQRFSQQQLLDAVFDLTSRGFMELKS